MNSKSFVIIEQEQMSNNDKDQISYIGQVLNFRVKVLPLLYLQTTAIMLNM